MAPSLIASYAVYSAGADSSTLTTPSFTPANGEVILVKCTTWSTGITMSTPTGGGQTYAQSSVSDVGGFAGYATVYTATVSGSPGAFTISSTPSASSRHSMVVERWGSAKLAVTPATPTPVHAGTSTFTATITTAAANSVCSWCMVDENSVDPATRVYQVDGTSPLGTEDGLYDGHVGSNSVHYFAYTTVLATAAAHTFGLSAPGALNWAVAGVEIQAATAVEVDLAVNFTGTGGMTAGLLDQVPLAAGFTATGGMTAGIANEAHLADAMTATGGMSAALANEVHLSVGFTATGGMSAALSVPNAGPADPIGMPVAQQLLTCLTTQLQELPSPPKYIQLRVGQETGPLIGPNTDECCAGLAWVRIANIYPSWDSFPAPDNTWLPCGPLGYAVVLEMGVAFCMPWSDSDDSFDNQDPPSTADWSTAFQTQMQHQTLMRRAAACCWRPTQRRAVGEWTPLPVEAGCTGGKLLVTVSVLPPCGDC